MKIKNGHVAIVRDAYSGPTFGFNDIKICHESNKILKSYTKMGLNYQVPEGFDNHDGWFTEKEKFYVEEIEVFQVS